MVSHFQFTTLRSHRAYKNSVSNVPKWKVLGMSDCRSRTTESRIDQSLLQTKHTPTFGDGANPTQARLGPNVSISTESLLDLLSLSVHAIASSPDVMT